MAYLASRSQDMHNPPQTHVVIYHHIPPSASTHPLVLGLRYGGGCLPPLQSGLSTTAGSRQPDSNKAQKEMNAQSIKMHQHEY